MLTLTYAPLPEFKNILSASTHRQLHHDALANPWKRMGDEAFWFSRSAWALSAIAKWVVHKKKKDNISVWVPDFFCNSALYPLRKLGVLFRFYPVTRELEPDLSVCYKMAQGDRPDMFLLVHYLGQPIPTKKISTFCKSMNTWFIEDCAHVLQPVDGIGQTGDFVFYSPHKHLAVPNGALLIVRKNCSDYVNDLEQDGVALHRICRHMDDLPQYGRNQVYLWLVKRILQRLGLRSKLSSDSFMRSNCVEENENVHKLGHPRMSRYAKYLLSEILDSLASVAILRQRNQEAWVKIMADTGISASGVFPLHITETPYMAGFSCAGKNLAEEVFCILKRAGLPVTTWPDLPPEVLEKPDVHQTALHLRQTRFYLPVHQSMNPFLIKMQSTKLRKYV